jgi:uracil-DNA glycosylase
MTKREKYHELITNVREDYLHRPVAQTSGGPKLLWCEECEREINLWTYWQNSLDARIMLVGQDWGCPFDDGSKETMRRIQSVNDGTGRPFFPDRNDNGIWTTDRNLGELFKVLGYDIWQKQPDLFFTNFVLGYRNHGTSGSFRQKWLRDDAPYFKPLAEIVEPKVILCLGKSTYEGVVYSLTGQMKRINGFNRFLDSGENYQDIPLDAGHSVRVYAVAHCGTIGTMNRNRGKKKPDGSPLSSRDLMIQKQDWERINKYNLGLDEI